MRLLYSDILIPLDQAPIQMGMLVVSESGKIKDIISPNSENYSLENAQFYAGALIPGFVNAHCHLELSNLKNKVSRHTKLDGFVEELMSVRSASQEEISSSMKAAEEELFTKGCVAVGDISNGSASFQIKQGSRIQFHTFIERFGLSADVASRSFESGISLLNSLQELNLNGSLSPHAPYSVSDKLIDMIIEHCFDNHSIMTIHHQESHSENDLFQSGQGPMLERFQRMGISASGFNAKGKSSASWLADRIHTNQKIMLVHNTFSNREDVQAIHAKTKNAYFCLCPKANLYISNALPNLNMLLEEECELIIGTDSLASNDSLDMLDELRTIQNAFPSISSSDLFRWACLNGAKAMGMENNLGSFSIGKTPGIVNISNFNAKEMLILPESEARIV